MKFVCTTQINHSAVFRAGKHAYVSYKDRAFEVKDKGDQQYFLSKPKRFRKVGAGEVIVQAVKKRLAPEAGRDDGNELRAYLKKVPVPEMPDGIPDNIVEDIVVAYSWLYEFTDEIETGGNVLSLAGPEINEAIKDFVMSGGAYPVHKGGGWYVLSNNKQIKGMDKAIKAQARLDKKKEVKK